MICHVCQTPIGDDVQERTVAGEPVHEDCVPDRELVINGESADIAPSDVEAVREDLLEELPDDAPT